MLFRILNSILCLVILFNSAAALENDLQPSGIRVSLNKEALNQLHIFASGGPIADSLKTMRIPKITETITSPLGSLSGNVVARKIKIDELEPWIPKLDFQLIAPDKIAYKVNIETIRITGKWSLRWKKLLVKGFSDGDFNISMSQNTMNLVIQLNLTDQNELRLHLSQCEATVQSLDVDIQGSVLQWAVEPLTDVFNHRFRTEAGIRLCDGLRDNMDRMNQLVPSLRNIELESLGTELPPPLQDVRLDLGLSSPLRLTNDSITVFLEGQYRPSSVQGSDIVFSPEPSWLPAPASNTSISIQLSETVLNTLLESMFAKHDLSYYVTADMSPFAHERLQTTCDTGLICVGQIFPGIAARYPNQNVTLELRVDPHEPPPFVLIQEDRFQMFLPVLGILSVGSRDAPEYILTFSSTLEPQVVPQFTDNTISASVILGSVSMNVTDSASGINATIDDNVRILIDTVGGSVLENDINAALRDFAVPIPDRLGPLWLRNMEFWMRPGSMEMGSDVEID